MFSELHISNVFGNCGTNDLYSIATKKIATILISYCVLSK